MNFTDGPLNFCQRVTFLFATTEDPHCWAACHVVAWAMNAAAARWAGGWQAGNKRCHLGSHYKESNVDGLNSLHKYSLKLDFGQCCGGQVNCVWSNVGPYALIFG